VPGCLAASSTDAARPPEKAGARAREHHPGKPQTKQARVADATTMEGVGDSRYGKRAASNGGRAPTQPHAGGLLREGACRLPPRLPDEPRAVVVVGAKLSLAAAGAAVGTRSRRGRVVGSPA
jgi:hypothetical protein